MDPRLLTENGWKATALKFKIKDNGLQRALSSYDKLGDNDHAELLKVVNTMMQLAANLAKSEEAAAAPAANKYLTDLVNAAKEEHREVSKAKALAEKAELLDAKAQALQARSDAMQARADAKAAEREEMEGKAGKQEGDEQEEDETGDSFEKLKKALQNLKASKVPYHFIACDAKPYGLIVAKRDISKSAQHKKELAAVAGGSTRPPKCGTCRRDGSQLIFEMDKPMPGMARIFQKWIKDCTGLGFKVMVGTESADDEGNPDQPKQADEVPKFVPGVLDPKEKKEEPLLNMTAPFSIGASVGRGGKNKPEDVAAVQAALNRRVKAGLTVNGKCDPQTIVAIMDFQTALGQFKPDGIVQPGRGTARALASTAKLGPPPAPPKPVAPPKLGKATLAKAPAVWHGTRDILMTNIEELKKGVRAHYGAEHPDLLKEIDENLKQLGGVLGKLDRRLADSLENAHAARDEAARNSELKNAKTILADYIKYVKSESMIGHMDANPFGVDTNLKKVLMDSLTHMAQAIGKASTTR